MDAVAIQRRRPFAFVRDRFPARRGFPGTVPSGNVFGRRRFRFADRNSLRYPPPVRPFPRTRAGNLLRHRPQSYGRALIEVRSDYVTNRACVYRDVLIGTAPARARDWKAFSAFPPRGSVHPRPARKQLDRRAVIHQKQAIAATCGARLNAKPEHAPLPQYGLRVRLRPDLCRIAAVGPGAVRFPCP